MMTLYLKIKPNSTKKKRDSLMIQLEMIFTKSFLVRPQTFYSSKKKNNRTTFYSPPPPPPPSQQLTTYSFSFFFFFEGKFIR